MKANELRLGNLYDHWGEIKTVTPNVILEVWESDRMWCKPIPLTEEWLLKFGGKKDNNDIGVYIVLNEEYDLRLYLISGWIQLTKASHCPLYNYEHVKSVHQLQNLYFALTGEELTIQDHP